MMQPSPEGSGPLTKKKKALHRLSFHGSGGSLLVMMIINGFLTMLTLGIYSFWAKAKERRYLYSQLEFRKERFQYHGTGKEAALGWLKSMAILFVPMAAGVGLVMMDGVMAALGMLVIYGTWFAILPVAIVGSRKYRLSRTSLMGIRFSFRGDVKSFAKVFVPGALLTGVTLGLYYPFFMANMRNYLVGQSYFGTRAFKSTIEGKALFKDFIIAVVLHIPTLGLIWLWNMAKVQRYMAENTTFGRAKMRSTVTAGVLFKHWFVNYLLIMFTLGIAFPWVIVRNMRFNTEHLTLVGELDLDAIKQEYQQAKATGDELGEMMELDMGAGIGI